MTAERSLARLLEELEQDAERLVLEARDADVADLARAEYSQVLLVDRLHATAGREVALEARGSLRVRGRVVRVGQDWLLLEQEAAGQVGRRVVLAVPHLLRVRGLADAARVEAARGATSRLRLTSVLRTTSLAAEPVTLCSVEGQQWSGRLRRVGADFVELVGEDRSLEVVPVAALVALWVP